MPAPFELVNEFAKLQDEFAAANAPQPMGGGGGQDILGGLRTPRSYSFGNIPDAPQVGFGGGSVQGTNAQGLVSFGGKQVSAGLLPYAERLTSQFGLRLSGGYRDPHTNARTPGAAKNSWHMQTGAHGALDLVGPARQMQDAQAWARANGAREAMIHNAGTGMHLHLAW